jgi:4-hydroxy-tetrahydrodipicolinate synthase
MSSRGELQPLIRKLFDGKALVPGIKTVLAHIHQDADWKRLMPPFVPFPEVDSKQVVAGYDRVRAT